MHKYGLHWYNITDNAVVLQNTVSVNKEVSSIRQINGADKEKLWTTNLGIHQLKVSGGFFKAGKT